MRFIYVTDLHGDTAKYQKTLRIAEEENIKMIINGGDMLPKRGNRHIDQPAFIYDYLDPYFQDLRARGITYLAMLGNDDMICLDDIFDGQCDWYGNVYNIAGKKVSIDGYDFIGMNHILDHPFGCKDRVITETRYIPQAQLSAKTGTSTPDGYQIIDNWMEWSPDNLPKMSDVLNALPIPNDYGKTVYIMHMPPAGLHLGEVRNDDRDIGSWDIRDFFNEKQPLLTLHGHIHEAPDMPKGTWINTIGGTTCIQPGQTELHDEKMVYVLVDLDKRTYERKVVNVNERESGGDKALGRLVRREENEIRGVL